MDTTVFILVVGVPLFKVVAEWIFFLIVRFMLIVGEVREDAQVAIMDKMLGERGGMSGVVMGTGSMPMDGWHWMWFQGMPICMERKTMTEDRHSYTKYVLYIIGEKRKKELDIVLCGSAENIQVRWIEAPNAFNLFSNTMRQEAPKAPYPWQEDVILRLIARYYSGGENISILLSGSPGKGKSSLAELLAARLRKDKNIDPIVVKTTITAKGLTFSALVRCPTPSEPVIVVLDEYYDLIKHAEGHLDGQSGEGCSLVKNRASMLALMDRFGKTKYVIVVATTNVPLCLLKEENNKEYIRKGRIEILEEVA